MDVHHQNTVVAVKELRVGYKNFIFNFKVLDSNPKNPKSSTIKQRQHVLSGFHLVDLILMELKDHMTCSKFKWSH